MVKVSIIVPVYNGEAYLKRCLDSLVVQTLSDIEIIVVNDGSSDGTPGIMDQYEKKYPDLIRNVHNSSNMKLGSSRNVGVSHARGEYIAFVDVDDWVVPEYAEKLYNRARKEDADITICGFDCVDEKGKLITEWYPKDQLADISDVKKRKMLAVDMMQDHISFWIILFKRSVFEEKNFRALDNTNFDEDYVLIYLFFLVDSIALVKEKLYYWYQDGTSMSVSSVSRWKDRLHAADMMRMIAQEWGLYHKYKQEIEYILLVIAYMNSLNEFFNRKIYLEIPIEAMREVHTYIKNAFPMYYENKYLLIADEYKNLKWMRIYEQGEDAFLKEYYESAWELNCKYKNRIIELLKELDKKKVAIWGAGKKGQLFLYKNDPNKEHISYVFDSNVKLYDKQLSTGHIIVDYKQYLNNVEVVLVMNHKHFESVKHLVQSMDSKIKLIDVEKYLLS